MVAHGSAKHDDTSSDASFRRFERQAVTAVGGDDLVEVGVHGYQFPADGPQQAWIGMRRGRLHDLASAPVRKLFQDRLYEHASEREGTPEVEPFESYAFTSGDWLSFVPHTRRGVTWVTVPTRELWMVVHRSKQRVPKVRAVMEWVERIFADARRAATTPLNRRGDRTSRARSR